MPTSKLTRRAFCVTASAALFGPRWLSAQTLHGSSRPDVATIDHDRILFAASSALTAKPLPVSNLAEDALAFCRQVAALAAAFHVTKDERYNTQAVTLLRPWLIDPDTRLAPDKKAKPEEVLQTIFFAETAIAIPFLSLPSDDLKTVKYWFSSYLQWLTESRTAGLARDQKDHHATSWLLQTAAYARLTANETVLQELRHRFKSATLRSQIVAEGTFPHELTTPYPYRNSLFNLDLLAASCLILSSQFESLWDFELQDGPGLRIVMARHFPWIEHRSAWPYRADLTHFDDLPIRNPSLLFAAKAYSRPEYADLWKTLKSDPTIPEIALTFPITQPLLWTSRPSLSLVKPSV